MKKHDGWSLCDDNDDDTNLWGNGSSAWDRGFTTGNWPAAAPPLSQSFLFLATKNCRVARKNNITPMAFSAVTIQNVAA